MKYLSYFLRVGKGEEWATGGECFSKAKKQRGFAQERKKVCSIKGKNWKTFKDCAYLQGLGPHHMFISALPIPISTRSIPAWPVHLSSLEGGEDCI